MDESVLSAMGIGLVLGVFAQLLMPDLSSSFTFFSLRGRNSRKFIYC
jgi:hypothetical protein